MRNEIFDKVATHMMTQMRRSVDLDRCRYLTPDGLKCAVGCLIPDDKYTTRMEGRSIHELLHVFPELVFPFGIDKDPLIRDMLWDLQKVHDRYLPVVWKMELRRVANKWGVNSECLRAD